MTTSTATVYRVKPDHHDVPVRTGPHKEANIKARLEEGDRVFAEGTDTTNGYVKVLNVKTPGANEPGLAGCYVALVWLDLAYVGGEND